MNSPFGNLSTEGFEQTEDRLGGYAAKESGIYTGKVKAFYAGQSSGGAHNVTVILSGGDFGADEYRETIYITDKEGKNFYLNKQDQTKKVALPGFTIVDDIVACSGVAPGLNALSFEDKVMNIYDPEQQKEVPKSVPMAVALLGAEVSVGILKTKELKQKKNQSTGNYEPVGDGSTRDVNNIDKVFNTATKMTVAEARNGATEAKFWPAWSEKNTGVTRDRTTAGGQGKAGGPAPQAGANGGGAQPARTSLFGNNAG